MYAVIFEARIRKLDDEYAAAVQRLRHRAIEEFGCVEVESATEGETEITVSYWESLEQVRAWKADQEHREAQQNGRERWYSSYRVRVVEILRAYESGEGAS